MKRQTLLFVGFLLPASTLAMSNDPLELVRTTTETVVSELARAPDIKTDPDQLQQLVETKVSPKIDFARLSRLTLGKHWRTASPQQRQRFTAGFRNLLLKTYSTSLAEYSGQSIEYRLLSTGAEGRRATVRTLLKRLSDPPVTVDYRLYQNADSWKIYDVSIEGISLAVNYRSSFNEAINSHGLDTLIRQLTDREISIGAGQ